MSDEELGLAAEAVYHNGQPLPGSFEARMQERRVRREQRTTELFDVPGFQDLFRVEMQVARLQADERHRATPPASPRRRHARCWRSPPRPSSTRPSAFTWSATTAPPRRPRATPPGSTWPAPDDPTLGLDTHERVAIIRLLEGQGVLGLNDAWSEWNTHGNEEVDKELAADFSTT